MANGKDKNNGGHLGFDAELFKAATLEDIRKHGHVLTPGRYVGAEAAEDDGEAITDKLQRLSAQWRAQQQEAARLDVVIETNLGGLGYGG
jgi:type I restriction enzyme M protein